METNKFPFTKMQAVGNDFVVIEEKEWPTGSDWTKQALRLCDRNFGVGGDGLLIVGASRSADVRMRMFNPDGTEDMCGNGLRCVALLAYERGLLEHGRNGRIETLDGIREVTVDALRYPASIIAEMGVPRFAPQDLPFIAATEQEPIFDFPLVIEGYGERVVSAANTGSTHTVLWIEDLPADELFLTLSPLIEKHPLFPERTSVLWARVLDNGRSGNGPRLQIRIWERGVGETLGCGTGACAVAALAIAQNKVDGESVAVRSKGGTLHVQSRGLDSPLRMTGPAEIVFTGLIRVYL